MSEFDNLYDYFINGGASNISGGSELFQPYAGLNFTSITSGGNGKDEQTPLWQLPINFIFEENPRYALDIYDDNTIGTGVIESPFFVDGGSNQKIEEINEIDNLLEEINNDDPQNYDYIVIPINNSLKSKLATIKI